MFPCENKKIIVSQVKAVQNKYLHEMMEHNSHCIWNANYSESYQEFLSKKNEIGSQLFVCFFVLFVNNLIRLIYFLIYSVMYWKLMFWKRGRALLVYPKRKLSCSWQRGPHTFEDILKINRKAMRFEVKPNNSSKYVPLLLWK